MESAIQIADIVCLNYEGLITMNHKMLIIIILIFSVIGLGCITTEDTNNVNSKQYPLYYDEKAIYIMESSINVVYADMEDFTENPNELSKHSMNYYNEIDKLIVSPSLQPAVDEYKQAMEYYNEAAIFYSDTYSSNCREGGYDKQTGRYYLDCDTMRQVQKLTLQKLENGTKSFEKSFKLIP